MPRTISVNDSYWDRLLKVIPAEVVAGYIGINSLIQGHEKEQMILLVSSIILFIFTPFILKLLHNVTKVFHIIVSMLAYVIWVYALGGPFAHYGIHDPVIAGVIIILFTFFIPFATKQKPTKTTTTTTTTTTPTTTPTP
jgi:hypothetical protein